MHDEEWISKNTKKLLQRNSNDCFQIFITGKDVTGLNQDNLFQNWTSVLKYKFTSVVLPVQVDGNETFFVLNSNTIYFIVIFADIIESTKFIKFLSKLNVKTCSQWLKPDSCKTHQHKTDHLISDSRLPTNADSARPHHSLGCIYCYRIRHRQNKSLISFCFRIARTAHSSSQAWRTLAVILILDSRTFGECRQAKRPKWTFIFTYINRPKFQIS
jgi:hypothetical protein